MVITGMNNKSRSNKSICEKSRKMVTNIIKLSSFSIAKMSLEKSKPQLAPRDVLSVPGSMTRIKDPLVPHFPDKRSKEPLGSSKPISYLVEPDEGSRSSSYVIHEEESVDGQASEYIRKVHEKNSYDSKEMSNLYAYIMPPPPNGVMY